MPMQTPNASQPQPSTSEHYPQLSTAKHHPHRRSLHKCIPLPSTPNNPIKSRAISPPETTTTQNLTPTIPTTSNLSSTEPEGNASTRPNTNAHAHGDERPTTQRPRRGNPSNSWPEHGSSNRSCAKELLVHQQRESSRLASYLRRKGQGMDPHRKRQVRGHPMEERKKRPIRTSQPS